MKRGYASLDGSKPFYFQAKFIGAVIFTIVVIVLVVSLGVVLGKKKPTPDMGPEPHPGDPMILFDSINSDNLMNHLKELQNIATNNNGTRSAGTSGYNASMDYILETLKQTDYIVTIQPFYYNRTKLISPSVLTQVYPRIANYTYNKDYLSMGGAVGTFQFGSINISNVANFGCYAEDYQGVTRDTVLLVSRGNCTFQEKIAFASTAGAAALFIYNQGDAPDKMGVFNGNLGGIPPFPVFSMSFGTGMSLSLLPLVKLNISVSSELATITCYNIIADMPTGNEDETIVIGSHLDSIAFFPGINDNGSGSVSNLELALQIFKMKADLVILNRIRFAWWGAEEDGLLGSKHYVQSLNTSSAIQQIALNINLDMLGSPNFAREIYHGQMAENEKVVNGSYAIQNLYEECFGRLMNITYIFAGFNGRSDYGPFIEKGIDIPAGGVATGAEVLKTVEQQQLFGGMVNVPYDPCYHAECDTIDNINQQVLGQNAQCTGYVVQQLAAIHGLRAYLTSWHP